MSRDGYTKEYGAEMRFQIDVSSGAVRAEKLREGQKCLSRNYFSGVFRALCA